MTRGIASLLAAYLLGGVPFGLLLYRLRAGGDIRSVGSGNIGATNVARAAGWAAGAITLMLDAGKGAAGVLLARLLTGSQAWEAGSAVAAVAGHCFPAWLRLRGGKGVATGCGAFAVLGPAAMGIALMVFAAAVAITRMVSAGSVLAAAAFPVAWAFLGATPAAAWAAAGAAAIIIARHRENLTRMLRGEERRLGEPRKEGA